MATRSGGSSLLGRREFMGAAGMLMLGGVASATASEHEVLDAVARAVGTDKIKTLVFAASGSDFTVGQNFTPNDPWPRVTIKRYIASINYETGSMRLDLLREMGTRMPRGGGVPFTGELHQIQVVSGSHAWNEPVS
jgi:hypothetical protein